MHSKTLILIKHAMPEIKSQLSAKYWQLSEQGEVSCARLAQTLKPYALKEIISSEEMKAQQTAQITAAHLGLLSRTYPGLHEHDRQGCPYFDSKDAFLNIIQELFSSPNQLVFGNESANDALTRFDSAIKTVYQEAEPQENIAVVCHGTVMSLFVQLYNQVDGFELWKKLELPSMVVLSLPDFQLLETQFKI